MSKKCARCEKSVYPVEELRCLDKTWHKVCFRCFECGMTLNMKNYKGYNKQPYCEAHYPKVKHTQVADTPENARLAQNTKLQSQLAYHSEFEQARGKYTAVTDDPETMRILQNQKNISTARYHEAFEKQKGHKITVVDDPETVRARKNMEISSQVAYTGLMNKHADMEARRPMMEQDNQPQNMTGQRAYQEMAPPPPQQPQQPPPPQVQESQAKPSPYASRNQGQTTVYNAGGRGKVVEHHNPSQRVGSIADYDPMNENYGSITKPGYQQPQEHYNQQRLPQHHQQPQYHHHQQQQHHHQQQYRKEPEPAAPAPQHHHQQPQQPQGPRYQAMYDYESADADEVSFREGDIIVNTESIDEGWMTGTVQRTRQTGMLPANYVQRVS